MMFASPRRQNIEHITDINAPIQDVWDALVDLKSWEEWNRWTTLEASEARTGVQGKLHACYNGDGKDLRTFDFAFSEVDPNKSKIVWSGRVAGGFLFKGEHSINLQFVNNSTTKLVHKESFGGLLPALGLGLPYKTLDRNYLLMNKAMKKYVETKQAVCKQ